MLMGDNWYKEWVELAAGYAENDFYFTHCDCWDNDIERTFVNFCCDSNLCEVPAYPEQYVKQYMQNYISTYSSLVEEHTDYRYVGQDKCRSEIMVFQNYKEKRDE